MEMVLKQEEVMTKLLKHNAIYTNCIAVGNIYDGFDHNSNRGTCYNL